MTSERGVLVNQALGLHVVERSLFSNDERNLSVLGGEKETLGMREGVRSGIKVNVTEQGQGLNSTALVNGVIGEVHVPLPDGLALDTTEVDGKLLRVVLDDVNDGETVGGSKVRIGSVPDSTGNLRVVVQFHTHTNLLRTLTGEDIGSRGLEDLSGTVDNLLTTLVEGLNLDDLLTVPHSGVGKLDLNLVTRQDHTNETDLVRNDSLGVVVGNDALEVLSGGSRRPHAVGDGTRQRGKVGEVGVDVDGVEVTRDLGVGLIGGRSGEDGGSRVLNKGIATLQGSRVTNGSTVSLEILDNGVTLQVVGLVIDGGDLDEGLGAVPDESSTADLDRAKGGLVLVPQLRLGLESKGSTDIEGNRVVIPLEPRLGLKDTNRSGLGKLNNVVRLVDSLKGVLVVGELASVEEGRANLDNGLAATENVTLDLNSLTAVRVDDRDNTSLGRASIASSKRSNTVHHSETVGKVDKLEKVTVNVIGEDGFHDRLQRHQHCLKLRKNKILTCHPRTMAKSIGAMIFSFLADLNASPWLPTTSQNLWTAKASTLLSSQVKVVSSLREGNFSSSPNQSLQ